MNKRMLTICLAVGSILCAGAVGETTTYTFVTNQSSVSQTCGADPDVYMYRITGGFQVSVDWGEGAAFFDWVDATLSNGAYLPTHNLDELFQMTDTIGIVQNDGRIEFESVLDAMAGLDNLGDYHLTMQVNTNSVTLEGGFVEPMLGGCGYELSAVAVKEARGWTYLYSDDFRTEKARKDSYAHSVFWPKNAFPPPEPYLFYFGNGPQRGLVLMDYQGQPAHLGYCFPLGSGQGVREVKGTIGFDVEYPSGAEVSQSPPGYMMYSLSSDGRHWSIPEPVSSGHHDVAVESIHGTCYIVFMGTRAMIDNLAVNLSSSPATIHVPGDFPTIQGAIDASGHGDIIEVAPGVYSGNGNRDIEFRGKAITVRSAEGPEVTIIDCGAMPGSGSGNGAGPGGKSNRGFYLHGNPDTDAGGDGVYVLRGFTIRNGRIPGSTIPAGNQWVPRENHPIGAGIYCELSSPTIIDCVIENCGTELGGGIGCVGGKPVIINCRIQNCVAGGFGEMRSGGFGGGIGLIFGAEVKISGCVIHSNRGYFNSRGGGIYMRAGDAVVENCDISFNGPPGDTAHIEGGGIYCGRNADLEMKNCIVSNNGGYVGGGLLASRYDNVGVPDGGGGRNTVRVTNCTIAHNRLIGPQMPPYPGGGIHSVGPDIVVKNSIVWYNEGAAVFIEQAASKSPVVYSDIEGGYLGQGNLDVDPLFAPTGVPDYHLQSVYGRWNPGLGQWVFDMAHSPCIDVGDPTDPIGNEPFPNGGRINMGAYGGTRQASKGHSRLVYHVDGINGDDGNTGLSRTQAFATIQRGVNVAESGDTVMVWPAVYEEEVDFGRKAITVQSADEAAVVSAPNGYAFSFFKGERGDSVLRNFVIRDGEYGVFCNGASPTLANLTIVNNKFGVAAYGGADPQITDCILWYNQDGDLFQCDSVSYSCYETAVIAYDSGNVRENPLFADPNNGDYHLVSTHGRHWPEHNVWVIDDRDSPCIDAGRPGAFPMRERMPNGGRLNMGAYGGTPYASMSEWPLRGDVNRDGIVNMRDLAVIADGWLETFPWTGPGVTDIPGVGPVDGAVISIPAGGYQFQRQMQSVGIRN